MTYDYDKLKKMELYQVGSGTEPYAIADRKAREGLVEAQEDIDEILEDIADLQEEDVKLKEDLAELNGFITEITYTSIGKLSDTESSAINEPFYGYSVPIKNISNVRRIIVNDIKSASVAVPSTETVTCEICDSANNVLATSTATLHTKTSWGEDDNVTFDFENPCTISTGYVRIYCPVKISYSDNRNATFGNIFDGNSRVGQFLQSYGGAWTNLSGSQTKQFSLNFECFSITESKESKIDYLWGGTRIYVKNANELVDALSKSMNATSDNWYNIYLADGEYDLVPYIDLASITTVTAVGYRGIEVPRFTRLIGYETRGAKIIVNLDNSSTTTEQQWTVSTLNMKNDAELHNLYVYAKNCRYAIHDDGGNVAFHRLVKNCKIVHEQNVSGIVWSQQEAYGMGLYKGCDVTFEDCEFIGYGHGLYIHDNPNYNIASSIRINNCRFFGGNQTNESVRFHSMGASAITSIQIENSSFNKKIHLKIDNTSQVSMEISGWKNSLDTTLGIDVVN